MSVNFKKIASQETVLSEIMEGRTKVQKEDGVITIVDFDMVADPKGEAYAVIAINDTEFINGGHVLTRIVTAFVEACGGIEQAREEYAKSEPIRCQLEKTKTQSGRTLTKVTIL